MGRALKLSSSRGVARLLLGGIIIRKRRRCLLASLFLSFIPGDFVLAPLVLTAGLIAQSPAQAQGVEAVARIAHAITVRLEGATQGSGVLVSRDGNRYTVLTAWHVVEGQKPGEELDVFTSDGQRHQMEQGSIQRLGDTDIAVLVFSSSSVYSLAQTGYVESVPTGSTIFVSGFPLSTDAVNDRAFRFLRGDIVSSTQKPVGNSFRLLYNNLTLPGMSGGAVLSMQGYLVGIHAAAERADAISEASGKAIATGVNIGVPIDLYLDYLSSRSTGTVGGTFSKKSFVAPRSVERESDSSSTPAPAPPLANKTLGQRASEPLIDRYQRAVEAQTKRSEELVSPGRNDAPTVDSRTWGTGKPPDIQEPAVVRFGDSLVKIAQRYNLTIDKMLSLNPGLEAARLVVGTQIRLPPASSSSKPSNNSNISTSAVGVTLTPQSGSTSLYAWRLNSDGILELRTKPRISMQASYEPEVEGGLVGSRIWIDIPGAPPTTYMIPGSGPVLRVRMGRPNPTSTRLVVEFKPGTYLDLTKLRLVGTSEDRWRLDIGPLAAPSTWIGQGEL